MVVWLPRLRGVADRAEASEAPPRSPARLQPLVPMPLTVPLANLLRLMSPKRTHRPPPLAATSATTPWWRAPREGGTLDQPQLKSLGAVQSPTTLTVSKAFCWCCSRMLSHPSARGSLVARGLQRAVSSASRLPVESPRTEGRGAKQQRSLLRFGVSGRLCAAQWEACPLAVP